MEFKDLEYGKHKSIKQSLKLQAHPDILEIIKDTKVFLLRASSRYFLM